MMASHHDALWTRLHELELQLAAYKLRRAPRRENAGADTCFWETMPTCRGRQYEAYMRRRDARLREAAAAEQQQPAKAKKPQARATRAAGGSKAMSMMSPRALGCTARDAHEVKKTSTVPIPSTPRRDTGPLPRSRAVNGGAGATGSPARSHHLQGRSSLGAPTDSGDSATTPRPFLKRGTGTGGAAAPARPRVHDLPSIDVPVTPTHPQLERGHARAARRVRSVREPPFDTAALASPQTPARARKRWGSPERPAAMFSAPANSHRDFSQGLKRLLSFMRKGGKADVDPPCAAVPGTGAKDGKPVSKGWSSRGVAACSLLDVPSDRASLDGHRCFPTTRTVGISS